MNEHDSTAEQSDPPALSTCCGSQPSHRKAPLKATAASTAANTVLRTFDVSGLDCAEEVRILERAVGPVIGGTQYLAFDVLNGRMSLREAADGVPDAAIVNAVKATGMRATLVGDPDAAPTEASSGTRMTVLSGLALIVGMVSHVLAAEAPLSLASVITAHAGVTMPPLEAAAWLAAAAFGLFHVLAKAWYALKSLRPDMNLLMMIAVVGAIAIGEWFEAATVAFLFALSLTLEGWSVGRARNAVAALLELAPATVRVVDADDGERDMAAADVVPGTRFIVRAGDRVALDGQVVEGSSWIDQAPITGESLPVSKVEGDEVFAGTINGEGTLIVDASQAAQDTVLARITRSIGNAYAQRADAERWVDSFARIYTPVVMALALLVLFVPPLAFGADWQAWIYNALVLLVIACPCALVISTPVAIVAALASAARAGVLIKGGTYVEQPARLDAIAMDKTGTLTLGEPRVQRILALDGRDENALLAEVASLELRSSHPLAAAIAREAAARDLELLPTEEVTVLGGRGVRGRVADRMLWLGSPRYAVEMLGEQFADAKHHEGPGTGSETFAPANPVTSTIEGDIGRSIASLEQAGCTVVVLGTEQTVLGLIGLADTLRPDAKRVVAELHTLGVGEILMLTGDNPTAARVVAAEVGIDTVRAGLLPADKVSEIESLTARHRTVAMIGDGVNDAPAMARANFGVAMGAIGSDAAIETADIALMSDDLARLPWLIRHSRRTLAIIRQNIVFALSVKALFVGLTAVGLASLWGAIAADVGATLLVVTNALRLLRASENREF